MSLCCNTPYLARIEKIKGNRNGGYAGNMPAPAQQQDAAAGMRTQMQMPKQQAQPQASMPGQPLTAQSQANAAAADPAHAQNQAYPAPAQNQANPAHAQNQAYPAPAQNQSAPEAISAQQNPVTPPSPRNGSRIYLDSFPTLDREDMTDLVNPVYNADSTEDRKCENSPTGTLVTPVDNLFPDVPLFHVPSNPLLPPGYQETLDYTSIQYINGFYRTQIGRYVRVEYQTTSSSMESISGYLTGVGINYILLQDSATSNIIALDSYSIKLFYVYYNYEGLL